MRIKASIMKIGKDNYAPDGHVYTLNDLKKLAKSFKNKKLPVSVSTNFDLSYEPIGKVIDASIEKNELIVTLEMEDIFSIGYIYPDMEAQTIGFIAPKCLRK